MRHFRILSPIALFFSVWIFFIHTRAPYFCNYHTDPTYPYLLNSLNILNGHAPFHIDHPGTPVQLLGSFAILIRWMARFLFENHAASMSLDVLSSPEIYLGAINVCLNVLLLVGIVIVSYRFDRISGPRATSLFQLGLFASFQIPLATANVSPEPMLVTATLWVLYFIAPFMLGNERKLTTNGVLQMGVALGFGVATKLVFLPIILSVFFLKKAKTIAICLGGVALGFVVFTLPILKFYPRLFGWAYRIATHTGNYDSGPRGLPSLGTLFLNLFELLRNEPFLFVMLALSLIAVALSRSEKEKMRVPLVGAGIIFFQIAIIAKQPNGRYTLPALTFSAALLPSLYFFLSKKVGKDLFRVFVSLCLIFGLSTFLKLKEWATDERILVENTGSIEKILSKSPCVPVSYYSACRLDYALAFGNDFSGGRLNEALQYLYPASLFYNVWGHSFYSFSGPISSSIVASELDSKCFMFIGSTGAIVDVENSSAIKLKNILTTNNESLYRLDTIPSRGR